MGKFSWFYFFLLHKKYLARFGAEKFQSALFLWMFKEYSKRAENGEIVMPPFL